jgi:class 3 adenylate cyclase
LAQRERRLAAILAADVVGYSRLMSTDEEGTLERLQAHVAELIRPKVIEHRGRIVKTTGDGFLAEFNSVYDAFAAALQIQEGMGARNRDAAGPPMDLRIGINIGDIIFDEDDIFGDGVNIAARLEGLAVPGGICVSARAWEDLRKLDVPFDDLGDQQLKNIATPVRAYSVNPTGEVAVRTVAAGRRGRRLPYLLVALAAVAAVVAAGLFLIPGWRSGPTPEQHVQAAIDRLPCSWLRIAERSDVDGAAAFTLAGASIMPPDVVTNSIYRSAIHDHVKVDRVVARDVAPLLAAQCPWIEKIKHFRYGGVPRMTTGIRTMLAGKDSLYTPGTKIGEVIVRLNLRSFRPEVALFGIKPDGQVDFIAGKRKMELGRQVDAQGRATVPLEFDHSGWSGIVAMESDTPIPEALVKKGVDDAAELPAFDNLARQGHWRFELVWFHTDLGEGHAGVE